VRDSAIVEGSAEHSDSQESQVQTRGKKARGLAEFEELGIEFKASLMTASGDFRSES